MEPLLAMLMSSSSVYAYDFNVKPACSHKEKYVKNSRYNNNTLTNVRAASSDLKSGTRRKSRNPFISCFDNDNSFNEINLSNENSFLDHCHKLEKTQASMSNNNYCKLAKNSSQVPQD